MVYLEQELTVLSTLNSSFRYKRLAGGHIRFWRRYSVDSGGISSHDCSKNDTDSDYITETSIISAISSSFNQKGLQLYFIREIVIVKFIIIIKWLGTIFE